jgi:pimeloyl-ACP methyl ester carboxylesterase
MAVARAIAETDARPWLRDIDIPTLVVCGEDDRVTGMNVSKVLVDELRHASLLVIADAGHAPHIEQPERFARALGEFLQGRGS